MSLTIISNNAIILYTPTGDPLGIVHSAYHVKDHHLPEISVLVLAYVFDPPAMTCRLTLLHTENGTDQIYIYDRKRNTLQPFQTVLVSFGVYQLQTSQTIHLSDMERQNIFPGEIALMSICATFFNSMQTNLTISTNVSLPVFVHTLYSRFKNQLAFPCSTLPALTLSDTSEFCTFLDAALTGVDMSDLFWDDSTVLDFGPATDFKKILNQPLYSTCNVNDLKAVLPWEITWDNILQEYMQKTQAGPVIGHKQCSMTNKCAGGAMVMFTCFLGHQVCLSCLAKKIQGYSQALQYCLNNLNIFGGKCPFVPSLTCPFPNCSQCLSAFFLFEHFETCVNKLYYNEQVDIMEDNRQRFAAEFVNP